MVRVHRMIDLLGQLFTNPEYAKMIQQKLPPAFQSVEDELKGNPAVGLLREQVILGMLIAFLGERHVQLIRSGVNPDIDCFVDTQPLSIKTVSLAGGIRLKWTSNAVKAKEFMDAYEPMSHLLVVRIIWGGVGAMRLIPLDLQKRVFTRIGLSRYLEYRGATNTRGVNLSFEAESALIRDAESASLAISWRKSQAIMNPLDKWIDYWRAR
jgi:hypothetical protein